MLTQDRAEALVEFLISDQERAAKLFALDAEPATIQINAQGHDFSAGEIKEFGKALLKDSHLHNGEFYINFLDNITRGKLWSIRVLPPKWDVLTKSGGNWMYDRI
ncbi:MAG: hypothetical protein FWE32_10450 [Oscillospiraceae bacterium]|nr:hypothetical protein [Oscillospiraceae bacterium]